MLFLGASNFQRLLSRFWRSLQARDGARSVLAYCGLGRAYCVASLLGVPGILGRTLPAIGEALSGQPETGWRRAEAAFIGDLGNDLAYGHDAAELLVQLRAILGQLGGDCAVILLRPPVETVRRLGPLAFRALSSVLFPGRGIQRSRVLAELEELDEGLRVLSREDSRCRLLEVPPRWVGADRIHVRGRHLQDMADLLVGALPATVGPRCSERPATGQRDGRRPRFWSLVPSQWQWTVLGVSIDLGRRQPVHEEVSGATLRVC